MGVTVAYHCSTQFSSTESNHPLLIMFWIHGHGILYETKINVLLPIANLLVVV